MAPTYGVTVYADKYCVGHFGYDNNYDFYPKLSELLANHIKNYGEFLGWYTEDGIEHTEMDVPVDTSGCDIYLYSRYNYHDFIISGETLKKLGDAARLKDSSKETHTLDETISLLKTKIISFVVDSITYYAEDGMTWREYCDSSYNTDGFTCYPGNDSVVRAPDGNSDTSLVPSDKIIDGKTYAFACCFVAGTQVAISLNGETRNIEEMGPGDAVLVYDVESGVNYTAKVQKLIIHPNSRDMARVEFENGSFLDMRSYHPIYTKDGFRSILASGSDKLTVGCEAKTLDGWSKITKIIEYDLKEGIDTYTLAVIDNDEIVDDDTNDNFYANGVVVHNAGCK